VEETVIEEEPELAEDDVPVADESALPDGWTEEIDEASDVRTIIMLLAMRLNGSNQLCVEGSIAEPADRVESADEHLRRQQPTLLVIIGHAKEGITALLDWLHSREEVQMHDEEVHSLRNNKPAELASMLVCDLNPSAGLQCTQ